MGPMQESGFRVRVNPANPGQYFACCGLLELADRFWGGAEGWFDENMFYVRPMDPSRSIDFDLPPLLNAIGNATLTADNPDDELSTPLTILDPFNMKLNWWEDSYTIGKQLKVWAGTMNGFQISKSMQKLLLNHQLQTENLFDYAAIVYNATDSSKKIEPYYFDSRRGITSHSLDIGFSSDAIGIKSIAYPTVEFLCLIGLQRILPMSTATNYLYKYNTWSFPLSAQIAQIGALGLLEDENKYCFTFFVAFRTSRKKHKAFLPSTLISKGGSNERIIR
jgi:hypothetical protein